ncbi:hypothetical protein H311_03247 [Anncaliia algerae PRA109]|nr:hypothetical protein H311_03247 [Anncaliia algerae PRA109]
MSLIKLKYKNKIIKVKIDEKTRANDLFPIIEKELHINKGSYVLRYLEKSFNDKVVLKSVVDEDTPIDIIERIEESKQKETSPFGFLEKEINKNSELRQIIQSENFMEEMGKLSNDTNYYNQQAKNADIAMSRLETLPGGINLMNSMVNDISNPLNKLMDQNKNVGNLRGENISDILSEPIPSANNSSVNYLLIYREQLSQLKRIGFNDMRKNLEALKKCEGDLVETVEILTQRKSNRKDL